MRKKSSSKSLLSKIHRVPLRVASGAFVLNSGVTKWSAPSERQEGVHGMAAGAYPQFKRMRPEVFTKALAVGEIALGSALLMPFVPSRLAGLGLTAFSAGLVGLYWRTPGMHREGDPRPTPDGIGLAKDIWLLAIGLALATEN